jgi:hypothetical protein
VAQQLDQVSQLLLFCFFELEFDVSFQQQFFDFFAGASLSRVGA